MTTTDARKRLAENRAGGVPPDVLIPRRDLEALTAERDAAEAALVRVMALCTNARQHAGGPYTANVDVLSIERAVDGLTQHEALRAKLNEPSLPVQVITHRVTKYASTYLLTDEEKAEIDLLNAAHNGVSSRG